MSITRDQLRAARVLLHLSQMELAGLSRVSLSTIRRFERGDDIGHLHADALRRTLVEAGVDFIDGTAGGTVEVPSGAVGVMLRPSQSLPHATRARLAADALAGREEAEAEPPGSGPAEPTRGSKGRASAGEVAAGTPQERDRGGEGAPAKAPGERRKGRRGLASV